MAEKDALGAFDFNKVTGGGLFLKFEAGKPVTLRVLTTDPIVSQTPFTDKITGETTLSTRFGFIVYNFTDKAAQILQASPSVAKKIGDFHRDPDFGADIKKIDVKISPTGEGLERRYDIQVLPKANDLTTDMVKEAAAIDLPEKVKGYRMSEWEEKQKAKLADPTPQDLGLDSNDLGDEPINLDDIPF
jgi:hypothetical protein